MGEQFGRYRLERLLGRGGMGAVWLAHDTANGRTVALKVLAENVAAQSEYRQRFEREARLGTGLRHPNIVRMHRFGEHEGKLFIDMEYIEGIDLAEMLSRLGTLTTEAAVDFVTQVAAGLDAAHQAGLIHRDVKPSNILVGTGGHAYLIDFGIAHGMGQTAVTAAGMAIGSWAYMAPERFNGTVDVRSDVYSLACVLYECLTGRRPYGDTDPARQMHDHLMTEPPCASSVNPSVPTELAAVIARGMAKDQARRYPTAREFAAAAYAVTALSRPQRRSEPKPSGAPPPESDSPQGPRPTKQFTAATPTPTRVVTHHAMSPTPAEMEPTPPSASAARSPAPLAETPTPTPAAGPRPATKMPAAGSTHAQQSMAAERSAVPQAESSRLQTSAPQSSAPQSSAPQSSAPQSSKPLSPTKVMPAPGPTPTLVATRLAPVPPSMVVPQQNPRFAPAAPPVSLVRPYVPARQANKRDSRAARPAPLAPGWWSVSRGRRWTVPPTRPTMPPTRPTAPPRRRPRRRSPVRWLSKAVIAVIVVCVTPFILVAGCLAVLSSGTNGGETDAGSPPTVMAEDNPAPPRPDPGEPAPAGTPVRDGKFEFAVTNVDSGVSRVGLQSPGGTFMIVTVAVRNISGESKWYLPFGQGLIDTKGRRGDHHATATIWQNTAQGYGYSFELAPGQSATTQLVFDVPPDAAPSHLELHDFVLSDGVSVLLN